MNKPGRSFAVALPLFPGKKKSVSMLEGGLKLAHSVRNIMTVKEDSN
jgi:hypothetical protein